MDHEDVFRPSVDCIIVVRLVGPARKAEPNLSPTPTLYNNICCRALDVVQRSLCTLSSFHLTRLVDRTTIFLLYHPISLMSRVNLSRSSIGVPSVHTRCADTKIRYPSLGEPFASSSADDAPHLMSKFMNAKITRRELYMVAHILQVWT